MKTPIKSEGESIVDSDGYFVCLPESRSTSKKLIHAVNNIERVEKQRDDLLEAAKLVVMYETGDYCLDDFESSSDEMYAKIDAIENLRKAIANAQPTEEK